MIYITGDTHGDFSRVFTFCERNKITKQDILIVLVDAGINYSGDTQDPLLKHELSNYRLLFFQSIKTTSAVQAQLKVIEQKSGTTELSGMKDNFLICYLPRMEKYSN